MGFKRRLDSIEQIMRFPDGELKGNTARLTGVTRGIQTLHDEFLYWAEMVTFGEAQVIPDGKRLGSPYNYVGILEQEGNHLPFRRLIGDDQFSEFHACVAASMLKASSESGRPVVLEGRLATVENPVGPYVLEVQYVEYK